MSSAIVSRALVKGYASGALVMAIFGGFWASIPTLGSTTFERRLFSAATLIVAVALSLYAIYLLRAARRLPDNPSPEAARRGESIGKQFAVVGMIEVIAIVLASILLGRTDHGELVPLVIALIVGVHFLPLAYIFQVRAYYFTGVIMSLLALVALVALFFGVTLGGPYAWATVVGLGSALILWATALYILFITKRLLQIGE